MPLKKKCSIVAAEVVRQSERMTVWIAEWRVEQNSKQQATAACEAVALTEKRRKVEQDEQEEKTERKNWTTKTTKKLALHLNLKKDARSAQGEQAGGQQT